MWLLDIDEDDVAGGLQDPVVSLGFPDVFTDGLTLADRGDLGVVETSDEWLVSTTMTAAAGGRIHPQDVMRTRAGVQLAAERETLVVDDSAEENDG